MTTQADRDFTDSPELELLNSYSDSRAVVYQGTAEGELWDGPTLAGDRPGLVYGDPVAASLKGLAGTYRLFRLDRAD